MACWRLPSDDAATVVVDVAVEVAVPDEAAAGVWLVSPLLFVVMTMIFEVFAVLLLMALLLLLLLLLFKFVLLLLLLLLLLVKCSREAVALTLRCRPRLPFE